jgi:hypothetical protein
MDYWLKLWGWESSIRSLLIDYPCSLFGKSSAISSSSLSLPGILTLCCLDWPGDPESEWLKQLNSKSSLTGLSTCTAKLEQIESSFWKEMGSAGDSNSDFSKGDISWSYSFSVAVAGDWQLRSTWAIWKLIMS